MKILITRSSENQTIGGAELSARDQSTVLQKLGHQPVLSTNNRLIRKLLGKQGVMTVPNLYLQRFSPPLRHVYFWLVLPLKGLYDLMLVVILRPDVINPHTREDQITFTLLKPLHRRPVVWKDPGDIIFILRQHHGRIGSIYKDLYLYAANKADHIYLLNDTHRASLHKAVPGIPLDRTSSVPSSMLYSDYLPQLKSEDGPLIIGAVCRLAKSKDVATLIRAYRQAARELGDVRLLIVGDGPERGALIELANGDDTIEFAGHQKDVSQWLNQIDIFVNPATEEGWGRNVKEAMYFGKAVVGSNTGGIAQQIEHNKTGLLFEPGDVDGLAGHITHLARDKALREKLGNAAHDKAMQDGDFTRIVEEKIIPIYERVTRR